MWANIQMDTCTTITLEIKTRCSSFDAWVSWAGLYITPKLVKFDHLKCSAFVVGEMAEGAYEFFQNIEKEYDIGNFIGDGTVWRAVTGSFECSDGAFAFTTQPARPALPTPAAPPIGVIVTKLIYKFWTDLVTLATGGWGLTPGKLTFTSNFFSVAGGGYLHQILRIDITTIPNLGQTLIFEYD